MRSALCCLVLLGSLPACAAGEPLDGGSQSLALADDSGVSGLVYVDVADPEGRPLIAEVVWVSSDTQRPVAADCFDQQSPQSCPTWFADFEATDEINVVAEVCDETFVGTVSVEAMQGAAPASDGLNAAHVTVMADIRGCGAATPAPERKRVEG